MGTHVRIKDFKIKKKKKKESAFSAGDSGSIPGLGRLAGEGKGNPLWYSWTSIVAQLVKNLPAMQETWVQSLSWEDPWRREKLPTPVFSPGEFCEYSLERLMLKLKLQYFGHLM